MRCRFCGSKSIHPDTKHKTFSTGKAVAGAVAFGVVGAAAGFIGKDSNGYTCGACGAFMDAPMEFATETFIDGAIRDAEAGRSRSMYDYFKGQYINIQANIPQAVPEKISTPVAERPVRSLQSEAEESAEEEETKTKQAKVKNEYAYGRWVTGCPVYVEEIKITAGENEDQLSLIAWNQAGQAIRSAYFNVTVFDDTGDEVSTVQCVYQGMTVEPGKNLPVEETFSLNTKVAYRVELQCEKAALSDSTVWRAGPDDVEIEVPQPIILSESNFPRLKYAREAMKKSSKLAEISTLTMPISEENYRICLCGHLAAPNGTCPYCGITAQQAQQFISQQYLREQQLDAVKQRALERAKETAPMYEKRRGEIEAAATERQKLLDERSDLQRKLRENDFGLTDSQKEEQKWLDHGAETAQEAYITGQHELRDMPEKDEKMQLERDIAAKQSELKGLGIFKGKAKKALEQQIAEMTAQLQKCEAAISAKTDAVVKLQRAAAFAKSQADDCREKQTGILRSKWERRIAAINAALGENKSASVEQNDGVKSTQGNDTHSREIEFGRYEQGSGVKPVQWMVLANEGSKALLISKYGIECKQFNTDQKYSTWENCSLRKWLNHDFIMVAFTLEERKRIVTTTVKADKNPEYDSNPGNDTEDKVFLLSIPEAEKYFTDNEARMCDATEYAKKQGAWVCKNGKVSWVLRTPGKDIGLAANVNSLGKIFPWGFIVKDNKNPPAVRPAMWITMES